MASRAAAWTNLRGDGTSRRPGRLELIFLGAVSFFAFLYYRDAYRLGFDWGDMGSYVEYVQALAQGGKFGDVLGYGPLWYFLGVGIFSIWGADFGAVLVVFQIVIFASACMIWFAARQASGSAVAAGIAFVCIICVPPFYASSIRMLSLALFAWPLIMLARAQNGRTFWPLAAPAAAVGVNFALRPDFGYIYTVVLFVLLMVRAWHGDGPPAKRFAALIRSIGLSVLFILLPLVLIVIHAAFNGYLAPFVADLFSYPARLLFFLRHAGGLNDVLQPSSKQAASFLRILPLGAIIHGSRGEQIFSFLIYSTIAASIVAGANIVYRMIAAPDRGSKNQLRLTVLMIVATQWPGFALFRPDWVHFISFMHAYMLLAACAIAWAIHNLLSAPPMRRLVSAIAIVLIAAQLGSFVIYGVFVDASGWGVKRTHREAVFVGRNGVRQTVSADEQRLYADISDLVELNSKPGDRIVCVPYCAGFAFMTDRRVLFKEHYVDDGTLLYFPDWIDRAIALTEKERPPVVIVLDWAPNDTQASRFDVWAARYMDHIKQTYARSVPFGMGTIWIRDPVSAVPTRLESVVSYGPEKTALGVPFNQQPNGESALWMKLSAPARAGATIMFDDRPLNTVVDGTAVSALVPGELLRVQGRHWLKVVNSNTGMATHAVPFDVTPPP